MNDSDYFIKYVVKHFGAIYGYGPRFAPGSTLFRAENFGFILPAKQEEYGRWLRLVDKMHKDRVSEDLMPAPLRQRRSRAAQKIFSGAALDYSKDKERRQRLDRTDYDLDYSEMLLLPPGTAPRWLTGYEGLLNPPNLENLVRFTPDGSYTLLEVSA